MNADRTDKEQLIKELQERLDWYTFEASEEEFDAKEVEALVQLLGVMKESEPASVEIPDFEELLGAVARKQEAVAETSKEPLEDAVEKVGTTEKPVRFPARKFSAVAAAILAVVLLAGGTMGVVSAQKGEGFFHWLKRDETGEQIVISPNGDGEVGVRVPQIYEQESEVPEEYSQYLLGIEDYNSLKEFELDFIEITEFKNCTEVLYQYKKQEEKQILIELFCYNEKIMVKDEMYNDYVYIKADVIGDTESSVFSKENQDGTMEYMICFVHNNMQYRISGNQSLELLEEIAKECMEKI